MSKSKQASAAKAVKFIAHDWCGWNNKYGRFTAIPSGETLAQQLWMERRAWNKAQLEWFEQFDADVVVQRNHGDGPYRETGNVMGTVAEIVARLRKTLNA